MTDVDADAGNHSLARSAAAITVGNAVSRVTGFARVLTIAGVLGTTYLGNTYQTSNLVSNVLFELLAAGLLSSVLVPRFVQVLGAGRREEAEHVAGALLSLCLVVLGAIAVIGAVGGRGVMRLLTIAVEDPEVRSEEIRVGAFFLWFFLPQLLLYAWGAIATAALHADRRFAASAFAPAANNVVVIATMVAFWAMHDGGRPALDIPHSQRTLLALGTTAGVLAMTLMPVIAAWRAGLRIRPRWDPAHAGLRGLGRAGLWAAGYLACTQILIATTLVLANRVEGGVVAYQVAFTFFLLPHALVAHPVFTALFPRLASRAEGRRLDEFRRLLSNGMATVIALLAPATVLLVVFVGPVLRVVDLGVLTTADADLVGDVTTAYAIGLVGYSLLHLLTRASYALGEPVQPTLVNAGVTAVGVVAMVLASGTASGGDKVTVLGFVHSAVMLGGAVALLVCVARRMGGFARPSFSWRT